MNKEMSLDVALDIIGTLRMMKIDEIGVSPTFCTKVTLR